MTSRTINFCHEIMRIFFNVSVSRTTTSLEIPRKSTKVILKVENLLVHLQRINFMQELTIVPFSRASPTLTQKRKLNILNFTRTFLYYNIKVKNCITCLDIYDIYRQKLFRWIGILGV